MKKKIVVLNVVGLILMVLGVAAFFLGPWFFALKGATPFYTYDQVFANIPGLLSGMVDIQNAGIAGIIVLVAAIVCVVLWIVHLILLCVKKNPKSLLAWFAWLLASVMLVGLLLLTLTPGNAAYYPNAGAGQWGWYSAALNIFQNNPLGYGNFRKILVLIFFIAFALVVVVGFILMLIALIMDFALLGKKKVVKSEEPVEVDEEGEGVVEELGEEEPQEDDGRYRPRPEQQPAPQSGIMGPLLIQYINTYGPGEGGRRSVPVTEIADAINGEKPLTAEEIRKIIKEELATKEEAPAQPVIVSVPAPAAEEENALTADDIRNIIEEELRKAQPDEGDVVVEEEPAPALTADDIRQIIAEALAEKPAPEPEPVEEEPVEEQDVREIIREELAAFYGEKKAAEEAARQAEEEEAARKAAEEEARRQAEEEARRQAEQQQQNLTGEDIRKIIAEELAGQKQPEPQPQPQGLTAEEIREIIREELAGVVKEEPAPEPAPVVVEPEPEKPAEPAPAPTVTVVVQTPPPAPEPEEPKGPSPERIPFPTRLLASEEEVQENYNVLKSEILSYGVKSRVSNTGDTFRLHKVTYVKITVAGKGLKLYFALDPKDYADSKIPVSDAGHKGIYRDIPLVFKVKSDLSLRRAKQLIADVMAKFGNEKGEVEERDWAYALKDYRPAGADDEDE